MKAKEFFIKELSNVPLNQDTVIEALVEFANLHVKKALEEASKKATITEFIVDKDFDEVVGDDYEEYFISNYFGSDKEIRINKNSIISAYNKDNIE